MISEKTAWPEAEVNKDLVRAKEEISKFRSEKLLLEILENFEKALKEVRNLENAGTETGRNNTEVYREYLEQALELMEEKEIIAPYEIEMLRKGLPIVETRIDNLQRKKIEG